MSHFKITFRHGKSLTIEERDHMTEEALRDTLKNSDGKKVVLNGTTYLKEEILDVTEVKPRIGHTNMEGI